MPLDPQIALQTQTPQIDLGSIYGAAMQLRQLHDQIQTQNALKAVAQQPGAIDDKTGGFTTNALAQIMKISPQEGMKAAAASGEAEQRAASAAHTNSETQTAKMKGLKDAINDGLSVLDPALASGNTAQPIAESAFRQSLVDHINGLSISQAEKDYYNKLATESPLAKIRSFAMSAEARDNEKKLTDERSPMIINNQPGFVDKAGNTYDAQGKPVTATSIERPAAAVNPDAVAGREQGKWEVLTDPKTNDQYRYNPETHEATTLDGKPYSPQGAQRMGGGATPRSGAAAVMQKYIQEHPNATAEELMQVNSQIGEQAKAERDFGTGKQGAAINSFNVGIAHLNTLGGLVDALHNGDLKSFNSIANKVAEETGKPAPTNFDAAKAIVGDEIIKAIVGGGGALADRENAQNQLDRAKSPEQLSQVVKTYKDLMGGQLKGLKLQYEKTTGRDDFDSRLSDDTKRELGMDGKHTSPTDPAKPTSKASYDALPKGAHYVKPGDPPGTYRVKQ